MSRVIYFSNREAAERKAKAINNSVIARATGNTAFVERAEDGRYRVVQAIG